MDTLAVLRYGDDFLQKALARLPGDTWDTGGVCGVWSVKDIIAHLASYEHLLVDALNPILGQDSTPTLDGLFQNGPQNFNTIQVARYRDWSAEDILGLYTSTYQEGLKLAEQISPETWRQNGTLPWYGEEYALEDFIVYSFYGHKREHGAQINVFADSFNT